jgi:hypothetical protein
MKHDVLGVTRRSVVLGLAALLVACGGGGGGGGSSPPTPPAPSTAPIRLTYSGVGALGIFDPAVTLDPVTSRVW